MSEAAPRKLHWRAVTGALLFAGLVYVGLKPFYVTFLGADRAQWGRHLEEFPDRRAPGYVALLHAAGDHVPMGARVAVVFPTLDWPRGYSYAFFRAQYVLAGRVFVPLSWYDGPRPERIAEADYAIVYRHEMPAGAWDVLFQNADGSVLRRRR